MEVVTASHVAGVIFNGATIIPGGFGCCGHPDLFTEALYERYKTSEQPQSLRLFFASGAGDKAGKGLDKLAAKGMIKEAIGGFWGFCPKLTKAARNGEIEGHNWPMGVISHLFREIASGSPGLLSRVGLGSFVDPEIDGGSLSTGVPSLVSKTKFLDSEYLFYPVRKVDFALLRGSYSDEKGNISMSDEVAFHDTLLQAMAAKNSGGKVAVQVKGIVSHIPPEQVKIPAVLVDYVTICGEEELHPPTYGLSKCSSKKRPNSISTAKYLIVNRAIQELSKGKCSVNLGIGIPALIGEHLNKNFGESSVTIESGIFNGTPLYDLSFGASVEPDAIINQAELFTFYDGGGIDIAFLGFGEIDAKGRVNASMFGEKYTGAGGFINIAQSAKKIVLCGTLTTKQLDLSKHDGELRIKQEGQIKKFVQQVQQITIDTSHELYRNKKIIIITERAVFELYEHGLLLTEIAPGISAASIIEQIEYPISVTPILKIMDL